MKLNKLSKEVFEEWMELSLTTDRNVRKLFVVASGYEKRSSHLASKMRALMKAGKNCEWKVIGFADGENIGSRHFNNAFYEANALKITNFPSDQSDPFCKLVVASVRQQIKASNGPGLQVHIDYSSMPRRWYCAIFTSLLRSMRPIDRLFMWYCGGAYNDTELPTAGVSDVSLFSGRPSINPKMRTHVVGLGFDRIRASAIYRVLDPQNMICFLGGIEPGYKERVERDNKDLIAAARMVFNVPVDDFPDAFARITDLVRDLSYGGDVILVPDGPKPLVLASSLVPSFLERVGIVSLHVRRRKSHEAGWIDVLASGSISGFSVAGELVDDASVQRT